MGRSHPPMHVPADLVLPFSLLISVLAGVGPSRAILCRAACHGNRCVTLNVGEADFRSADAACRSQNGGLVVFQSDAAEALVGALLEGVRGNIWIGLRLPGGFCSNLSVPLRGYQWVADSTDRSFSPSSITWKEGVQVCSPHCVSLSCDLRWAETPCTEKLAGFLCQTNHRDACQAEELLDPSFFSSPAGCADAPCEHKCTEVPGGYRCSCYGGYAPNKEDPHRCQLHCSSQSCSAQCDRDGLCYCPVGFVLSGGFCEDIDECDMQQCDHECANSFGSYTCSCREGFVLRTGGKCARGVHQGGGTTTLRPTVVPALNFTVQTSSPNSSSAFLWVWICVAVLVLGCVFVLRYFVVKYVEGRELNAQQSSASVSNNLQI